MTVVVESSTDQVAAALNHGIFPVPAEVAADNAKQAAKVDNAEPKVETKVDNAAVPDKPAEAEDKAGDDVEGEDGLTPKQKREYTKQMLAAIGKKHRLQREAEEFAQAQYSERELANQRASKLQAELDELKAKLTPAKAEETTKPDRANFKDDQEYWDAMVDYRADLKIAALRAEQAKADQERFVQEETQHAQAKMDRAIELGPDDFKEVYESADIVLPNYVLEAIKSSDLMPEIVYFLGSPENAAVGEKIKAMTAPFKPGTAQYARAAQRQLVEIGKIESMLKPFAASAGKVKSDNGDEPSQSTTVKVEPETGSAPSKPRVNAPIIKPLNGGSASQVEKDEADLSGSQMTQRWAKKHQPTLLTRKRH